MAYVPSEVKGTASAVPEGAHALRLSIQKPRPGWKPKVEEPSYFLRKLLDDPSSQYTVHASSAAPSNVEATGVVPFPGSATRR